MVSYFVPLSTTPSGRMSGALFLAVSIFASLRPCMSDPSAVIRVGIILSQGSSLPYDYNVLGPALETAIEKSLTQFNIQFIPVLLLYQGGCSTSGAAGQTFYAANSSVDLIVGPACTADMLVSMATQTFFDIPSITGGGELADSAAQYPYGVRSAFNTYTQWLFAIRMFTRYNWTNIAIIYDKQDNAKTVNAQSLMKNIQAVSMRYFDNGFTGNAVKETEQAEPYLKQASKDSRVFVLLMSGLLTRSFMIAAQNLGYTGGDYIFFALDAFRNDILGPNGWQQHDRYDQLALTAYRTLFVLTLMDTSHEPEYFAFVAKVQEVAESNFPLTTLIFNYYTATFHDAVMIYAQVFNETVALGESTGSDNVLNITRRTFNRTFMGATGRIYMNPNGDRNDDHALYNLDSDGKFRVTAEFFGYKVVLQHNYFYDEVVPFDWGNPTNTPPPNEPICGYRGEKPICDYTSRKLEVSLGVVGVLAVLVTLVSFIAYKIIHRRHELEQLDMLGTWQDITRAQCQIIKTSKKTADEYGSHTSLDPKGLMDNSYPLDQTINAYFKGSRVMLRVGEADQVSVSTILREVRVVKSIQNDNVARLVGLCTGPYRVAVMYAYCSKGSLQDLLATETVTLDWSFRFSLIKDLVNGLMAITNSPLTWHGRLTSTCVFVDAHFVAKIGDFGLPSFFARTMPSTQSSEFCVTLLWTAPERLAHPFWPGTQEGDIYSFAIILSEIITRQRPYASSGLEPEVMIAKLQQKHQRNFRPKMDGNLCPPEISVMIRQCWAYNPLERPRLPQIKSIIKESERNSNDHGTILDNLIRRMEDNTLDLKHIVEEKTLQFAAEREKTDQLLYQILPRVVVDQLKRGEQVEPEDFDSVTVYYSDIVAFTTLSSSSTPSEVVDLLNDLYIIFDNCIMKFDAYKVETVGDCYVVASGVPNRNGNRHAGEICRLALLLLEEIKVFKIRHRPEEQLRLRLGAHTGPCVSGVVGLVMPRFCLFGETITIAGKMESSSQPMRIQISEACEKLLQTQGKFDCTLRDEPVIINDRLEITTYWLNREITPLPSPAPTAR